MTNQQSVHSKFKSRHSTGSSNDLYSTRSLSTLLTQPDETQYSLRNAETIPCVNVEDTVKQVDNIVRGNRFVKEVARYALRERANNSFLNLMILTWQVVAESKARVKDVSLLVDVEGDTGPDDAMFRNSEVS